MNDITNPTATEVKQARDVIAEKVARAVHDTHVLFTDLEKARAERDTWERRSHQLQAQVEILERELEHTKNKRDFFMRHSTELLSQLSTIENVIRSAIETAKIAGYRPPLSTSPTTEPATAVNFDEVATPMPTPPNEVRLTNTPTPPPIPKFLTEAMSVGVSEINNKESRDGNS